MFSLRIDYQNAPGAAANELNTLLCAAAAKVAGSKADTSKSKDWVTRVSAAAPARPKSTPTPTIHTA